MSALDDGREAVAEVDPLDADDPVDAFVLDELAVDADVVLVLVEPVEAAVVPPPDAVVLVFTAADETETALAGDAVAVAELPPDAADADIHPTRASEAAMAAAPES